MSQSEIRLEDLLDSVADAVSALVVFANEVIPDKKKLDNLKAGIGTLKEATDFFAAEVGGTVTLWNNFGNHQMATEMQGASNGIREATQECVDSVNILVKESTNGESKRKLLDAGKNILKHMVRLLQLNDLYEVTLNLKQIQVVKQMLDARNDPKFAVSEFTLMYTFLSKLLSGRAKRCYEGRLREQLEDCSTDLGRACIPFGDIEQEWLNNMKNQELKQNRELYVSNIVYVLKRSHDTVRASAKSPFDLSMLDKDGDFDFDEDFVALSNSNWYEGLDSLQSAIKDGDESELESALRSLKKDVLAQLDAAEDQIANCTDPKLKAALQEALDRLKNQMGKLLDTLESEARKALKARDPELIRKALEDVKRLRAKILDGLAKDQLIQHAVNIDSLLSSLWDAAKAGDMKESTAIVHDIDGEAKDMDDLISTLAMNIDDDPSRRQRLEDGLRRLKAQLETLAGAVPDAIGNPKNQAIWDRLQDAMDRLRGITNDLVNASMQTTPQQILGNAVGIDEALRKLREAVDAAKQNPSGVPLSAAQLLAKIKPQLELAQLYAAAADPTTASAINRAIEAIRSEASHVASASKEVSEAAGKKSLNGLEDALRRMREAMDRLKNANGKLVDVVVADAENEMKLLTKALEAAERAILEALRNGDVKAAAAALKEFEDAARKKALLARVIGQESNDAALAAKLNELAQLIADAIAADQLLLAVKSALRNPKDAQAYQLAQAKLRKALEIATQMDKLGTATSTEDKFAQNGKVLVKTAELVKLAVNDDNFTDAGAHLKTLREQLAKHRQLANAIADACDFDPNIRQRLMDQCDQLDDLYKQIVVATKASMNDPAQKKVVAALVAQFQAVAGSAQEEARKAKAAKEQEEIRRKKEAEEAARRRKLEEEDLAGKNDIYKAAHKVTQAVNQGDEDESDQSPQAMLIRIATKVANAMKKLSELSETSNAKETIEQARGIAEYINEIVKWSNKVADECSDAKLAKELRDAAAVSKNFAIQLKIVCAVKASSPDDPTAHRSLVTCAQGLCKNVVECVNVSRVAKLKKKLK